MNIKRTTASIAAGVVLALAVATPALATVQSVGGGTWDWGTPGGNNWSHYYHRGVRHGSSVTGDVGLVRSGCGAAGTWTYTWARDTNWLRIDRAYWRYC